VWDTATWAATRAANPVRPVGAVVRWNPNSFPDSTRGVAVANGVAVVRDFATGTDVAKLGGHFAPVTATVASPDGGRIATASADGLVRVWDAATLRPLVEPRGHRAGVLGVTVSPDGKLAATSGADGSVIAWTVADGREIRAFAAAADPRAAFAANGTAVRFRTGDGWATRDLTTGLAVETPHNETDRDETVSPDGRTRVIADPAGCVWLVEAATGEPRRKLAGHRGACRAFAFTPDGTKLLTGSADHTVLVWAVRLRDVPLPPELKRETSAAKLWNAMATGTAAEAYPAMARMAADPPAAVAMARMRLKPGTKADRVADVRAVELLEALDTAEARKLLKELVAGGNGVRSREAAAALMRLSGAVYNRSDDSTHSRSKP
jgi:WD40 repeat protein